MLAALVLAFGYSCHPPLRPGFTGLLRVEALSLWSFHFSICLSELGVPGARTPGTVSGASQTHQDVAESKHPALSVLLSSVTFGGVFIILDLIAEATASIH